MAKSRCGLPDGRCSSVTPDVLRAHARLTPPTVEDFWEAWRRDHDAGLEPDLPRGYTAEPISHRLRVPDWLEWREGTFAHQGPAVDAVLERGGGILSIATGGGKTKTALIASTANFNATTMDICAS